MRNGLRKFDQPNYKSCEINFNVLVTIIIAEFIYFSRENIFK